MWPWGHAAVGYLLYSIFSHTKRGEPPGDAAALITLLGTQVPDLIDKPLAWLVHILPTGRSLGHSLFTAVIIIFAGRAVFRYMGYRELTIPFAVGHLSGILTDLPVSVLSGDFSRATFLLWPYLPSPHYPLEPSFIAHIQALTLTPYLILQFALGCLMLGLWVYDGAPGLAIYAEFRAKRKQN